MMVSACSRASTVCHEWDLRRRAVGRGQIVQPESRSAARACTNSPWRVPVSGSSVRAALLVLVVALPLAASSRAEATGVRAKPQQGRLPLIRKPNPALDSISCVGPETCWVIGDYGNLSTPSSPSSDNGIFALHLKAGRWSYIRVPAPRGYVGFDGGAQGPAVSCSSDNNCWAAGGTNNYALEGPPSHDVAIHWSGKVWRLAPTPSPRSRSRNVVNDSLQSVSCPTPTMCWAVGFRDNGGQLALELHGGRWQVGTIPSLPAASYATLESVSCVTSRDCWAVGTAPDQTGPPGKCGLYQNERKELNYALLWNGTRWRRYPVPSGSTCTNDLGAVACASAQACWAVGQNDDGNEAVAWNGRRWRPVSIPRAPGMDAGLVSLACPSVRTCWGVGVNMDSPPPNGGQTIFRYSDGSWHIEPGIPRPPGNILLGLSCGGANSCWAVGYFEPKQTLRPEVVHWNGRWWSLVP